MPRKSPMTSVNPALITVPVVLTMVRCAIADMSAHHSAEEVNLRRLKRAYSPYLSPIASRIAARCKRWNVCARFSGV